jgi:hypothetical protein
MTSAQLVQKVENAGGQFVIEGRVVSLLWPAFSQQADLWPEDPTRQQVRQQQRQQEFQKLAALVLANAYSVQAWVLERQASQLWEKSNHWLHWWRE